MTPSEPTHEIPPPRRPQAPAPPAERSGAWIKNLGARLFTALIAVPAILWSLYEGPLWAFQIIAYLAALFGVVELSSMTLPGQRALQAWFGLATFGLLSVIVFVPSLSFVAILGVVLGGMLVLLARPDPVETAGARMAWLVAGPLYLALPVSVILYLQMRDNGGSWVVLSMMFAWFGDTGAYFAGRFFGKHKLYPKISPKKTVEGSVGGLLGSLSGALVAHYWYLPELPLVDGIVLAVVAGALGQAGDLCASLIKRSTGVKDSGWILPGHGGILDRIDGLLYTGAAIWVYLEVVSRFIQGRAA